MMLFLQNDTGKLHPAGFDLPRQNIFDPAEDPQEPTLAQSVAKETPANRVNGENISSKKVPSGVCSGESNYSSLKLESPKLKEDNGQDVTSKKVCGRQGCNEVPRFDSIFCSDSCGVSTLETDLLRSLQYANKLHVSVLRSTN